MSKVTSFDPARLLTLYFRTARAASKKLVFTDNEGEAFDITGIAFELVIKRWPDGEETLKLTIGDGLSVGGVDSNELTIALTELQSALAATTYFWELINATAKKTWLNGDAIFNNARFDAPEEDVTELTIVENGGTVTIVVADSITITDIDGGTA